ncbi:DNA primase [Meridianimarinicoccus sp. MJW13]|uniref:DNA primase n=1 Tax=Meridianimarinicoccus sp. MJW13 TaxID=2720031 RepID=UPI0018691036|nr:DNA primase [Fluviibacterium sp. MJW13]
MSLPPGFLEELRTRTSLSGVVGRKVLWDARKSNPGRGDMWAPCPFHEEKTASFHVDDRKGFYYCFGCQAKGDAISFLRETENMEFMEAVRALASDAGMTVPENSPQERERAERRNTLTDVMEEAVRFFRRQLSGGGAAQARAYLERRGLDAAALDRFEIGFAPNGRQVLQQHLVGKGISFDQMAAAGLARSPQDGRGSPYDVFRDRIIFPIRDPRGRCIAFGGRAMAADAQAKYLNSPDTDLFDKSRTLYNHGPARTVSGKDHPLVVAEGYMDVIALCRAGFEGAVAPLGTAVTEHHLQMLWRMSPEPILALDGDTAGVRAAMRVIDRALPLLEAGRGLRFCLMPQGKDPDDLIREQGREAMQTALDSACPMIDLLWLRETEGKSFDGPDRRAALDARLQQLVGQIPDKTVQHHYRTALRDLQWQAFRPPRKARAAFRADPKPVPSSSTRNSLLAGSDGRTEVALREAVILATVISTPEALDEVADTLAEMSFAGPDHQRILDAVLMWHMRQENDLRAQVLAAVGAQCLEKLFTQGHVAVAPAVRAPGNLEIAEMCLSEELPKLQSRAGLEHELREAVESPQAIPADRLAWRLAKASEARNQADRSVLDDRTEYDTGANGAKLNRDEKEAFGKLIDRISFSKPKRR